MLVPAKAAPGAAIGNQVGNVANSINDYNQLRATQALKIKELEEALAKCGNCPQRAEIESALAYWRNVTRGKARGRSGVVGDGGLWNT